MKIYYITQARIPTEKAHGYQICKMCEEFSNNGVKVELFFSSRENVIKSDLFDYYNLKNNFKTNKIKIFDFLKFDPLFRSNKIMSRIFYIFNTILFDLQLLFLKLDKDRDAYVYVREVDIGYILSLRGHRVIFESHNWPFSKERLFKKMIKKMEKIVVITNSLKRKMVDGGLNENKIIVAPDAVDLNDFDIEMSREEAREKLKLPQSKKIVLYIGSFYLHSWKGVDVLLESAKDFANDVLFLLVGGNNRDVKNIKCNYKNQNNILLLLHQPHPMMPVFLKAADVLVLPNKSGHITSEKYTSPMKLFEYMASRRPIVASDLESIREILNDNNSFLFKPNDPNSLSVALKEIINNEGLGREKAERAHSDVRAFTWRERAKNISNEILTEPGKK